MKSSYNSPKINAYISAYLELCKFKVVALMLFSALVGMLLSYNPSFDWYKALISLFGIGLLAGSGGAINHIIDKKIDKKMKRTKNRPLPKGKVTTLHAICLATFLAIAGTYILWNNANPLATYLTAAAMVGYAFIYTGILKHVTPQNIVIGGISGAVPPLIGWVSLTGEIAPEPLLLVLIIFVWTPPHFWALAIARYDDYIKSNVPMLPATHGIKFTKLCILLYAIITAITTVIPYIIDMSGIFYLIGVTALNVRFIYLATCLYKEQESEFAMPTFLFSIKYLMLLFLLILLDHIIMRGV
ncbi:MAG: protoheme IX farnesyltransferase [Legionellales bacterium]|jgi:heme o synthase|nr:protoheme IX farnesyltransferase [Legionellales bacterium]